MAQSHSNNRPGHAPGEVRSVTLNRMLIKAQSEGVQIFPLVGIADAYVAISTGKRGAYTVRPGVPSAGCNCDGYRRHGYCKHYALACHVHGLPVALDTVQCPECGIEQNHLTDAGVCQKCEDYHLSLEYDRMDDMRMRDEWELGPDIYDDAGYELEAVQ